MKKPSFGRHCNAQLVPIPATWPWIALFGLIALSAILEYIRLRNASTTFSIVLPQLLYDELSHAPIALSKMIVLHHEIGMSNGLGTTISIPKMTGTDQIRIFIVEITNTDLRSRIIA